MSNAIAWSITNVREHHIVQEENSDGLPSDDVDWMPLRRTPVPPLAHSCFSVHSFHVHDVEFVPTRLIVLLAKYFNVCR